MKINVGSLDVNSDLEIETFCLNSLINEHVDISGILAPMYYISKYFKEAIYRAQ